MEKWANALWVCQLENRKWRGRAMCGITGWIDWQRDLTQPDVQSILSQMGKTLECRGPDDANQWVSPRAAFAHTRLIVVDPEGGAQPMSRQRGDRSYVMVYNGELYNTEDIRSELKNKGYTFRSHSDTEVLLTAYMEWGPACLDKLNGIFAFGIWDEAEQSFFMARDRIGVKPLFYSEKDGRLLFGSELKSILAHPEVEPILDTVGLSEIFAMGPSRTPGHGVFQGIEELRPGCYLIYDQNGLRTSKYWSLESKPHQEDLRTTVGQVRELFQDAVTRQLVSDVPVCTLLSGGLDSSAITAIVAEQYKKEGKHPLQSYSIDYVDNDKHFKANQFQPNSDDPWAEKVAEYLGIERYKIELDTPQLVDALHRAVLARDLPGMADVDSSLLLFSEAIKRDATVALSGECADEIFGGYPWFHREEALNSTIFPWSRNVKERIQFYSDELNDRIQPEAYIRERYQEALDEVPRLPGEKGLDARIREMFYLNLTRWMPTLLDRKDRMSMAVGLEVRVPYCDHRLVEYVWNVPWSMKMVGGQAKGLLREALKGILPDEVLFRKKSPYPKTHNPDYLAATKKGVQEILSDEASPLRPLLNQKKLQEFLGSDLQKVDMPWFGQLMNVPQLFAYLMQVDTWMREYGVRIK
jgi:asparagine synthase (glutamine-hydrolysing)